MPKLHRVDPKSVTILDMAILKKYVFSEQLDVGVITSPKIDVCVHKIGPFTLVPFIKQHKSMLRKHSQVKHFLLDFGGFSVPKSD